MRPTLRFLGAISFSFVVVPVITWAAFQTKLNLAATSLLQLLAVLGIALRMGFWPAAVASVLANLFLNYFFIPPLFTLNIADPQNWVALGVFEISALIVSRLSTHSRDEAARAKGREQEIDRLYQFSVALLKLSREDTHCWAIVDLIARHFAVDAVVLFDPSDGRVHRRGHGDMRELEKAVRWTQTEASAMELAPESGSVHILRAGDEQLGAIGLCGKLFTPATISATVSLVTFALERARSIDRETEAQAQRMTEQLRTTVMDALAHEYKTPLTALRAAASGLLEIGDLNGVEFKLVSLIDSQVERLASLTTRLLQTSHLDSRQVRLRSELVDTNDLVQTLVAKMPDVLGEHEIRLERMSEPAFVKVDRELVGMALAQFLDNAVKHSQPATPITVSISATVNEVSMSVHNFGPLIPPEERDLIFQRFYRGVFSRKRVGGTGIGLSISRRVAEAHSGRVMVKSAQHEGNTFSLTLPRMEQGAV